jgi:hypothetical protein
VLRSLIASVGRFVAVMYSVGHDAHGIVRDPDEGSGAHIWQLLMAVFRG